MNKGDVFADGGQAAFTLCVVFPHVQGQQALSLSYHDANLPGRLLCASWEGVSVMCIFLMHEILSWFWKLKRCFQDFLLKNRFKMYLKKITSTPNTGLELTAPRSRVARSIK